jgi:hypothetical protein
MIPEGTARQDALRLTKKKAKSLPRVTAYATCTYESQLLASVGILSHTTIYVAHINSKTS